MRLIAIRNRPKQTISSSGRFGLLQMVSELDIGQCASENVGTLREWIVRSHVGYRGEQNIPYKDMETSPLLAVSLDFYKWYQN